MTPGLLAFFYSSKIGELKPSSNDIGNLKGKKLEGLKSDIC